MPGGCGSQGTPRGNTFAAGIPHTDWGIAAAAGAASLLIYIPSLHALPGSGDEAEFQVLAHQFGVTHAPGHAVYITLGKLATLLPVGSVSYRVNLLSALGAASALAMVFVGARAAGASRTAALIGSLTLAFSLTFWSHAVVAEVYTVGAAFLAAVWTSLFLWDRTGNARPLFVAGLVGALGAGVDTGVALQAPACILFVCQRRRRDARTLLMAALGAMTGAAGTVLALVATVVHAPPANVFDAIYRPASSQWGVTVEYFGSIANQIQFIATARPWRFAMFDWALVWMRAHDYLAGLPVEFGVVGLLLISIGALVVWQNEPLSALTFAVALAASWLFTWTYRIPDIAGFYIPGYLVLVLMAAKGTDAITQWCTRIVRSGTTIAPAVLACLLGIAASDRWARVGADDVPYQPIVAAVDHLPRQAIVFAPWSELYTFYYAAHVHRSRQDLRFIEVAPFGERPGLMPRSTFEFLSAQVDRRPVFFSQRSIQVERQGYGFRPCQLGSRVLFRVTKE